MDKQEGAHNAPAPAPALFDMKGKDGPGRFSDMAAAAAHARRFGNGPADELKVQDGKIEKRVSFFAGHHFMEPPSRSNSDNESYMGLNSDGDEQQSNDERGSGESVSDDLMNFNPTKSVN